MSRLISTATGMRSHILPHPYHKT